ncbi:MAG: hypothetical protein WCK77_18430 [Verrucomicrobiota bacterium]
MIEKLPFQGKHAGFTSAVELTRQVNCAHRVNFTNLGMEGFRQLGRATGDDLVDGAEAARGGEGSGLEGIVIHHAFHFDLLGDAFEPFLLGFLVEILGCGAAPAATRRGNSADCGIFAVRPRTVPGKDGATLVQLFSA